MDLKDSYEPIAKPEVQPGGKKRMVPAAKSFAECSMEEAADLGYIQTPHDVLFERYVESQVMCPPARPY